MLLPLGSNLKHKVLLNWIMDMIPIIEVDIPNSDKQIKFYCPNEITHWRAQTAFDKEPETIEWIDSFDEEDVLWDIGANIGVYSLYAASKRIRTFAFEPSSGNYWILNENISINRLDDILSAYPIAFSDKKQVGFFNMGDMELGGAVYRFGESLQMIECGEEEKVVTFKQGMIGVSIDEFVKDYNPLLPNHIKIDVDSIEVQIVKGAINTLKNKNVKSVLIELDSMNNEEVSIVCEIMNNCGLRFLHKKHSKEFTPEKYKSLFNYIFIRAL